MELANAVKLINNGMNKPSSQDMTPFARCRNESGKDELELHAFAVTDTDSCPTVATKKRHFC